MSTFSISLWESPKSSILMVSRIRESLETLILGSESTKLFQNLRNPRSLLENSLCFFGKLESVAWEVCIFRLGGLHLPLGTASSAWVVCIFRSGGLHVHLAWFASSAWGTPTTPQHTESHPGTSRPKVPSTQE